MNSRFLKFLIVLLGYSSLSMGATIQTDVLAVHNKFRSLHHAPNLIWDNTLANYAENHASRCQFRHSGGPYGENIAAGYPAINEAIKAWYNEQSDYSYAHPGFSMHTGHFTQLVWKTTKRIGCGYVTCDGQNGTPGNYLVCEYSPRGNIVNSGYFRANVLPH